MTTRQAMRIAWWLWFSLLLLPFIYFIAVMVALMNEAGAGTPRNESASNMWFIGSVIFMCVVAPLSFFLRSHLFRPYWRGEVVPPKAYVMGMAAVWLALELSGIVSLTGCLVTKSLLPCILPGIAAFVLFLPLWPSGHAMVRRNVGNADDPGRYEEPG
jgi:hypothetical protein